MSLLGQEELIVSDQITFTYLEVFIRLNVPPEIYCYYKPTLFCIEITIGFLTIYYEDL